jgi:mRNA interferase MazF
MAGKLSRGDVHLCRFQSPDKERPVLIPPRDSSISFLSSVTVAPVTSTVRGVRSEVALDAHDGMKGPCAINLQHAVTVLQQRLGRRVTRLSAARMHEVCVALNFSCGCG